MQAWMEVTGRYFVHAELRHKPGTLHDAHSVLLGKLNPWGLDSCCDPTDVLMVPPVLGPVVLSEAVLPVLLLEAPCVLPWRCAVSLISLS